MDVLRLDLVSAYRNLRGRPGFSALAVLTLAVGIGVNAVAFSALNGLLFGPSRLGDVDRLGWVIASGVPNGSLSLRDVEALERDMPAFDAVGAMGRQPVALRQDGPSGSVEQVWAQFITADYFRALGAEPESGRLLNVDDARSDLVTVVSHRFWKAHLGGGSIAGRTLILSDRSVAVVGVAPDRFHGAGGTFAPDLWLPLSQLEALAMPERLRSLDYRWLAAVVRLAPNATSARAATELAALETLETLETMTPRGQGSTDSTPARPGALRFYPMRDGHPELKSLAPLAWIALAVIGLVLLLACFNVTALLLSRANEREREIAVRAALGAARSRIIRQLITEGLVLATLSGAAALIVAAWSGQLLAVFSLPSPIPQRLHMEIDSRLIGFTALITLVAGVLPGLMPALHASRRNLEQSMRLDGGARSASPSRVRNAFVVVQVAGSTAFLAVALLFSRSFVNALTVDPGFDIRHTVVAELDPSRYGFEGRTAAFAGELADRLSAIRGVSAAIADRLPFAVGYPRETVVSAGSIDCRAGSAVASCRPIQQYAIGPRHFATLGVTLRAGREFTPADLATGGMVIVSETLAGTLWPGRSPLGEAVALGRDGAPAVVVGVAADYRHHNLTQPSPPVVYTPYRESDLADAFSIVVSTDGDRGALVTAIRDTVRALAPAVPIASLGTMSERMDGARWPIRTIAGLFLTCGALALILATVGMFGVTYYAVRRRTREFGIRIALGARSRTIVREVLGDGLRMAVPGALLGLTAAAIAGRLLARALLGVSPVDPFSFAAAAVVEVVVALLASALPAKRATESDPMVALRAE